MICGAHLVSFIGGTPFLAFAHQFTLIFAPWLSVFSRSSSSQTASHRPESGRHVSAVQRLMCAVLTLGKFAGQWDLGTGEIWYPDVVEVSFSITVVRNPGVC
jgi:hypothetical protein